MAHPTIPPLRREALRNALQASLDSLHRRRASEIPEGYIDDYVSLNWLEWRGGGLKLTPTGEYTAAMPVYKGGCVPKPAPRPSPLLPLPPERAELARQGAKAAARGDSTSANPMCEPQNAPDVTGESRESWTERRDAWLAGHELQCATVRDQHTWSSDGDDEPA